MQVKFKVHVTWGEGGGANEGAHSGPGGEWELQRRRFSWQEPRLTLVLPATDAGAVVRGGGGGGGRCATESPR